MSDSLAAYKDLLKTCDYAPEEIERELPRVKKAFDRAGLIEQDVKRGRERLITYYGAADFKGARMALGLWIRAFVDLLLSGEEHEVRLYVHLPSMGGGGSLLGAAQLARPDVYVGQPDLLCHVVLGGFFNRLDPLLEAGESFCLPPGLAHCACSQAKIGARLKNIVPPGSLHLSAGNYCDEAPKVDEVIAYHLGERVFWVNRCQDEAFDDPPMDDRHLKYFSANLERARQAISEVIGAEATKDMVLQNIIAGEAAIKQLSRITHLRVDADPSPISAVVSEMAATLLVIYMTPDGLKKVAEMLGVMADEVQDRVERGVGIVEKGAPRVMYAYCLPFANPGLGTAMEEAGLNLCCQEGYGTMPPWARRESIARLDPLDIIAGVFLHSPLLVKPSWRADTVVLGYRKARLDGVIMLPHYSCRVFGTDYPMMRDMARKVLGDVPIFILETDVFDPRYYTAEQARTRIESFAEMVKSARVSAG